MRKAQMKKYIRLKKKALNNDHKLPLLILKPREQKEKSTAVLWMHGGGYIVGSKGMVYMSRVFPFVKKYNTVVISPGYRLAWLHPYPAAINDCYAALIYIKEHAEELGIRDDQIMVGGESAGGGLSAALCMMARDKEEVNIAYQMPLYPMLDNFDTESSADNHGKIWNTKLNHLGWKKYLRSKAHEEVSSYASPSREKNYEGLPPAYTFVTSGEPFYKETLTYIDNLKKAGVEASVDVFESDVHAFDIVNPVSEISKQAIKNFEMHFRYAQEHYFAEQKKVK